MSTDERKSYCLRDAHIVAELAEINDGRNLEGYEYNSIPVLKEMPYFLSI
jgi:hypothetical protein